MTGRDDLRGVAVTAFEPDARLRDRVQSFEVVHGARGALTVLPGAAAVLGLQFVGRVRAERGLLAPAGVTGIQSAARRYEYIDGASSLLVRFTAQGAACLGVPGKLLANRSVGLADLLPQNQVHEVLERLCAADDDRERVNVVQRFLLDLPFHRDRIVTGALTLMDAQGQAPSIRTIAAKLGLSERQLERRFSEQVGVAPKRFLTLRRFERAVRLAQTAGSMSRAAQAAGYYDQAHLARDFRRFAGVAARHFDPGSR